MKIGILESLLIPDIATEADDITKQVNSILGGKNSPAETKSQDQREEDLTKTDNIFDDIKKDDAVDNPQDNPVNDTQDNDETDTEPETQEDPAGADELNDSLGETSDQPSDIDDTSMGEDTSDDMNSDSSDMDGSEDQGMNPEDKSIFSDKNTLKKNMIYFFNIIRYTITSLEDALSYSDNQETIRIINSVIQNLYSSKDALYDLLTKQMEKESYEVLVTKYITIKRIYDISCDILEEHFTNNPQYRIKYKRFKNKSK